MITIFFDRDGILILGKVEKILSRVYRSVKFFKMIKDRILRYLYFPITYFFNHVSWVKEVGYREVGNVKSSP